MIAKGKSKAKALPWGACSRWTASLVLGLLPLAGLQWMPSPRPPAPPPTVLEIMRVPAPAPSGPASDRAAAAKDAAPAAEAPTPTVAPTETDTPTQSVGLPAEASPAAQGAASAKARPAARDVSALPLEAPPASSAEALPLPQEAHTSVADPAPEDEPPRRSRREVAALSAELARPTPVPPRPTTLTAHEEPEAAMTRPHVDAPTPGNADAKAKTTAADRPLEGTSPETHFSAGGAATAAPPTVVPASALDGSFRLLALGEVRYPPRARRLRIAGEAHLELEIDEEGRVRSLTVVSESGDWGFGNAARRAYAQARFTPPTVDGRPVRVLWRKTLRFRP